MIADNTFWKKRSKRYNRLQWVKNDKYITEIVKLAGLDSSDVVLDVGCGTGVISNAVSPFVKEVVCLDKSKSMGDKNTWPDNSFFVLQDIRHNHLKSEYFDKVIARMVFHHIITNTQKAMSECFRVLKNGGMFLIAEGIPPSDDCVEHYTRVFRLKERRIVFSEKKLVRLMRKAGFKDITVKKVIIPLNVDNWLANSGLAHKTCRCIKKMYVNAPEHVKKAYDARFINGNIILKKTVNVIVTGRKM